MVIPPRCMCRQPVSRSILADAAFGRIVRSRYFVRTRDLVREYVKRTSIPTRLPLPQRHRAHGEGKRVRGPRCPRRLCGARASPCLVVVLGDAAQLVLISCFAYTGGAA